MAWIDIYKTGIGEYAYNHLIIGVNLYLDFFNRVQIIIPFIISDKELNKKNKNENET
jgi:hypothetical protein